MQKERKRKKATGTRRHILVFLAVLFLGFSILAYMEYDTVRRENSRMGYITRAIGSETYETILSEMNKTKILETYLIQTDGSYEGFEKIADELLQEDYVRNVLFAPDGIVESVYPLEGNEAVLGLNMYEEGAGNKEAQAAIAKKELYIAGPFDLIQGGEGIAGRLPVYLEDESGTAAFWGVVSVTLDFPAVLSESSISEANAEGFACEVWRINPDTGQKQTILSSDIPFTEGHQTVSYEQEMFNSTWTISMSPLKLWYERLSFWLGVAVCLLVAFLTMTGERFAYRLRQMKEEEAKAEIERLQEQLEFEQTTMLVSQIRSHFFYHTLNSLQALIILEPSAAYKMAGDFSRYMRFSLDSVTSEGGIGPFRDEIRAVMAYADINKQQLGSRLTMVYHLPEADFQIPLLTIQPIVENAIIHGIKPKVSGGTVTLTLKEEAEAYRVTVEDDGVGFAMEAEKKKSHSIGIDNVRRRMALYPGCSLHFESRPGGGTRVTLYYGKHIRGSADAATP